MGKKTPAERRAAQAQFEKRKKIRNADLNPFSLSDEQQQAAAVFACDQNPDKTAELSGLPVKVVVNIANGRFKAQGDQVEGIVKAALQMGWTPEI